MVNLKCTIILFLWTTEYFNLTFQYNYFLINVFYANKSLLVTCTAIYDIIERKHEQKNI